jgi:hypothetical protein
MSQGNLVIGVRTSDDDLFDILTPQVRLHVREPSLFAIWRDHRFRESVGADDMIVVTFAMRDYALLRAVGLPVVLGNALSTIRGRHLDDLCDCMGWDRAGRDSRPYGRSADSLSSFEWSELVTEVDYDDTDDVEDENDDTEDEKEDEKEDQEADEAAANARFVADVAAMERDEMQSCGFGFSTDVARVVILECGISAAVDLKGMPERVIEHLSRLQRDLEIRMSDICLWSPDLDNQRLRTALEWGTPDDVRHILAESAASAAVKISASQTKESTETPVAVAPATSCQLRKWRQLRLQKVTDLLASMPEPTKLNERGQEAHSKLIAEQLELERVLVPWPPNTRRRWRWLTLSRLTLTESDLRALRRQGHVAAERRNNRTIYKLRFRVAGRQKVRYLGSDPEVAKSVAEELRGLQRPTRQERALRRLLTEVARYRRDFKAALIPHVQEIGCTFHGFEIRRPRKRKSNE